MKNIILAFACGAVVSSVFSFGYERFLVEQVSIFASDNNYAINSKMWSEGLQLANNNTMCVTSEYIKSDYSKLKNNAIVNYENENYLTIDRNLSNLEYEKISKAFRKLSWYPVKDIYSTKYVNSCIDLIKIPK